MPRSRDETLALLGGRHLARLPAFSGLPSLTAPGLAHAGVRFGEAHADAEKMARAAASTFEMFGFESAVVPFDLCVEAEACGCEVDFDPDADSFTAPVISGGLDVATAATHLAALDVPAGAGRVPLVASAIRKLKSGAGREVAIGAWVPGPFTLAWQLYGPDSWLTALGDQESAGQLLARLADALARIAAYYCEAGADFITVHEMGGSPQAVGPRVFGSLVKPAVARLLSALPPPRVLSVCGDTNAVVEDLQACGADALNVDHCNDLARTRRVLGAQAILLGNFDPVEMLSRGTPETVAAGVTAIAEAGANAVWPGCDLWPAISESNFRALMSASRELVDPSRLPKS